MKLIITESQYNKLFNNLDDSFYGSVEETNFVVGDLINEAEYKGRKVTLNKPFLTPNGPKKRSVYVKNEKGNVVKVNFGDPNMKIKHIVQNIVNLLGRDIIVRILVRRPAPNSGRAVSGDENYITQFLYDLN